MGDCSRCRHQGFTAVGFEGWWSKGVGFRGVGFMVQSSWLRVQGAWADAPASWSRCAAFCTPATPESWEWLSKMNFLCRTAVFKCQERLHRRWENDPPIFALCRRGVLVGERSWGCKVPGCLLRILLSVERFPPSRTTASEVSPFCYLRGWILRHVKAM